tara:strand:+ start:531 stop:719 length:189 start_codon:yes stop_codon:yes gene_type:complete
MKASRMFYIYSRLQFDWWLYRLISLLAFICHKTLAAAIYIGWHTITASLFIYDLVKLKTTIK